jgi:hypothetical protein
MSPNTLLLLNLAIAFYLVGAIWAHEVDIFRSWRFVDAANFRRLQSVHWKKLPYWIFTPLAIAFGGSVTLVWYHPIASTDWAIYGSLSFQCASHLLTAILWGPWQAKLSYDDRGPASPYLAKILATHWLRTLLITGYGITLLTWAIRIFR